MVCHRKPVLRTIPPPNDAYRNQPPRCSRRSPLALAPMAQRPVTAKDGCPACRFYVVQRSEEHTSELQSLMRISYAVFCLKKKNTNHKQKNNVQYTNKLTKSYKTHT